MRTRALQLSLTAAVLFATATARPVERMSLASGSRLWFDGTSTLRSWTCTADRINALIDAEVGATESVLDGRKATGSLKVAFPVANLECKNGTMNEHMRNALAATKHAEISFELSGYDLAAGTPVSGTVRGTLTMNGQSRPISVPVQFARGDSSLRVTGKTPLTMTDWGIRPPRLMLGTLKVGDVVTVQFDFLLQR